ncbi:MAG: hypothetical protein FRX49_12868 [Trebouxia sp. A1-2]|nr:MAG: hypothetical protein FRX49_12868 [Trebouxia sp. A1-2]
MKTVQYSSQLSRFKVQRIKRDDTGFVRIEDGRKDFKVTKYSCSLLIWLTQKGKNEELTPVGNHDRTLQRRQPKAMAHTPANYSCGYRQQHNSQPVNAQTRINISDIT